MELQEFIKRRLSELECMSDFEVGTETVLCWIEEWEEKIEIKNLTELEKVQKELIALQRNQIVDLTMMSKIELGDDVIQEIIRLQTKIKELK